jgi:hypothetical protein
LQNVWQAVDDYQTNKGGIIEANRRTRGHLRYNL